MRSIAPLLVAIIAATPAACGPESFHRDQGGAGGVGGVDGAGGAGGMSDPDAGGDDGTDAPPSADAADSDDGDGVPASDADGAVDAAGLTCPTTIGGVLESTDQRQVGRHSRIAPISACGALKPYPGNSADPTNPHVFDVYRFVNPTAVSACFTFTLTYPTTDAGPANDRYLVAYSAFDPTNIMSGYLGDVGGLTTSPQTMGVTVAAGASIDVVVYAVQDTILGNPYVGPYTLSCATP